MQQPFEQRQPQKEDTLRIFVAGRFLQPQEAAFWLRQLNGSAYTFLWGAVLLLLGVFFFSTLGQLQETPWNLRGVVVAVITACSCLCVVGLSRFRKQQNRWILALFSDRMADKKAVESGATFAFYDDRVVSTTLRGSDTIWFSDVIMCTESANGFALQTKTALLFLRSADLTAFDLHCIRTHLQTVIAPRNHHVKATAIPRLTEALPIPRFFNFDTVLTRATVPVFEQPFQKTKQLKALLLPMMVLFSVLPAVSLHVTPWLLLDLIVFAVLFGGIGLWISLSLDKKLSGIADWPDLQIAFTKDGLAVLCNGITEFTIKQRLKVRFTKQEILVRYTSGERLRIPLSAVDRPELLKTLWLNDASAE